MTSTKDIDAINARSNALRKAPHHYDDIFPYYGYFDVDIYECPPFVMFTNNDSPVAANILNRGTFEPQSLKVWCRLARSATGILDIGANVGVYSLCAAGIRPDLTVHAFEPNPYAFARLRVNKEVNCLANISEHREAVGHENGMFRLSWNVKPGGNISSGGGIGERNGVTEEFFAILIALDQSEMHTTLGAKPLIKIDVEGAELLTMSGMSKVIGLKPDIIIESFSEETCQKISAMFANSGCSFYGIREAKMCLEKRSHLIPADFRGHDHDFNQLITFRSEAEIAQLMA